MPVSRRPYPIAVKVYTNNQEAIEDATVTVRDTTTREELASDYQESTNSAGEAIVNLMNLESAYSDGDNYELKITKAGYEDTYKTDSVSVAGGGDTHNIYMNVAHSFGRLSVREMLQKGNYGGHLSEYENSFRVWVNEKTLSGSAQTLTSGGGGRGKGYTASTKPVINLNTNQTCYVTKIQFRLATASDNVTFSIVKCANANGGGTATAVTEQFYYSTGATAADDLMPFVYEFAQPIKIKYDSSTAKSVGMRVTGNDSSATLYASFEGFVMEDIK